MPPTLDAVAQRAGYSPATVSRVINNSAAVSPTVRAKVERAIRELGYLTRRPLQSGPALVCEVIVHRSAQMERIEARPDGLAVVGPPTDAKAEYFFTEPWRFGNDFYHRILNGILAELKQRGGKALLQPTSDLDDATLLRGLKTGTIPVLLVGDGGRSLHRLRESCRRPIVLVDMPDIGPDFESVSTNNLNGIGQAVAHLAELGHRRLGFVGSFKPVATCERTLAFALHAQRLKLDITPGWGDVAYDNIAGTTQSVLDLLGRGERPTGIVCGNDYAALAVLLAARQTGLSVPGDLSVVGFDDIALAATFDPPLTSIKVDCEGIGRMAVRMLLSQPTADRGPGCCVRLLPRLVVRSSTAPPRG